MLDPKDTTPFDPDEFEPQFKSESGHVYKAYDDGQGPWWLYRDASGLMCFIRARSYESAYEVFLDEFAWRISEDDLPEAYGLSKQEFEQFNDRLGCCPGEYPDLIEGYHYQPNATGTGIVSVDLNGESLEPVTGALLERLNIKLSLVPKE
jgi:hypothetical protein